MSGSTPKPMTDKPTKASPTGEGTDSALEARKRRPKTILTSGDEGSPTTSILGG